MQADRCSLIAKFGGEFRHHIVPVTSKFLSIRNLLIQADGGSSIEKFAREFGHHVAPMISSSLSSDLTIQACGCSLIAKFSG